MVQAQWNEAAHRWIPDFNPLRYREGAVPDPG